MMGILFFYLYGSIFMSVMSLRRLLDFHSVYVFYVALSSSSVVFLFLIE